MSLLISKYFDDLNMINTTADWNLILYLKNTNHNNIYKLTENELNELYKNNININLYFSEKYNTKLINIVNFDCGNILYDCFYNQINHLQDTILNSGINFYQYIVDIHHNFNFENNNFFVELNNRKRLFMLLTYGYFFNIHNTFIPHKIYYFPHSIIHKCDINNNPINKILVSGRGRKNVYRYPYRAKMYSYSLVYDNYIEYLKPNVDYRIDKKQINEFQIFGKSFVMELNKYLVCFCDEGNAQSMPNIFSKFFEILSSGALLITFNPVTKIYFQKIGFIDRIHYWSMSENLLDDIMYVLNSANIDEINNIRLNGYNKVWQFHNVSFRSNELINILEGNNNNYIEYNDGISDNGKLNKIYHCNNEYLD